MLFEGLHLPLTTPFYPDGRLNLRKLEHNVDRYSKTPAAGLVVLGQIGEPELLSDSETRDVLSVAIQVAGETRVMTAGVSRASVEGTLELAEFAASAGYDAVRAVAGERKQGRRSKQARSHSGSSQSLGRKCCCRKKQRQ